MIIKIIFPSLILVNSLIINIRLMLIWNFMFSFDIFRR